LDYIPPPCTPPYTQMVRSTIDIPTYIPRVRYFNVKYSRERISSHIAEDFYKSRVPGIYKQVGKSITSRRIHKIWKKDTTVNKVYQLENITNKVYESDIITNKAHKLDNITNKNYESDITHKIHKLDIISKIVCCCTNIHIFYCWKCKNLVQYFGLDYCIKHTIVPNNPILLDKIESLTSFFSRRGNEIIYNPFLDPHKKLWNDNLYFIHHDETFHRNGNRSSVASRIVL